VTNARKYTTHSSITLQYKFVPLTYINKQNAANHVEYMAMIYTIISSGINKHTAYKNQQEDLLVAVLLAFLYLTLC